MDESMSCVQCGQEMSPEAAFCSACGHARADLWDDMAGFVANGRWFRPNAEFVRRIDLEEMRKGLLRSSVLVPGGSVGVVCVDGEVREVLRPGKRTTVTWLDRLVDLFTDKLEHTSFYLIDLRPIPVPLRLEVPIQGTGTSARATATLLASVDRSSPTSLATFLQTVVRERDALEQKDLHLHLAQQAAQRMRQMVVDGLRKTPEDDLGVAARVAAVLNNEFGPRLGLHLDLLIDLTSVRSLDLSLGRGEAPQTRRCDEEGCEHEMPAGAEFCPSCGTRQALDPRVCGDCGESLGPGQGFCTACGARWSLSDDLERPLFTHDGRAVEMDLLVRIQGAADQDTLERIQAAARTVVSAEVRRRSFADLGGADGFRDLARVLTESLQKDVSRPGVTVQEVVVLDLRAKGEEWLLGARAEMEQRRQEMLVGREWLAVENEELDVQKLAYEIALRRRQLEFDRAYGEREAEIEGRRRQEDLADQEADLAVRAAEREAQQRMGEGDAARSQQRHERGQDHTDTLAGIRQAQETADLRLEHRLETEDRLRAHQAEGQRQAMELDSERVRRRTDDEVYDERARQDLQLEKLQEMARLDEQIAAADHGREMERRAGEMEHQKDLANTGLSEAELLALQAGELAGKTHGDAAFAALEGARVAAARQEGQEALLRSAAEARGDLKDLMQSMTEMQQRTVEAALGAQATANSEAASMAEKGLDAMSKVRAASVTPPAVVAAVSASGAAKDQDRVDCRECGQPLTAPYRFCGRCGAEQ